MKLIEIPTLGSPEDGAAGVGRGWWRVSHWCAGCEWGTSSSCYSAGDERVVICGNRECIRACSSTQQARSDESGAPGMIPDADRCVAEWCGRVCERGCMLKRMFAPWLHAPSCLRKAEMKRGSRKTKKREVGKVFTGQVRISQNHDDDDHSRNIMSKLHVCSGASDSAVTETACSGKMFHLNLIERLFPEALTCVSLCLCVFSWSSSDTCWSRSGWSINLARVFCACE